MSHDQRDTYSTEKYKKKSIESNGTEATTTTTKSTKENIGLWTIEYFDGWKKI